MDRQVEKLFRSHVELCLRDIWGLSELKTDQDGDYPFRSQVAAAWVSVRHMGAPSVAVFAHVVRGLKPTAKLLGELNELNSRSRWARVYLDGGLVLVATELPWSAVDVTSLGVVLEAVTSVADDVGELLAAVHGGALVLDPLEGSTEDAA